MENEAGIVDFLKFHLGKRLKHGIISHLIKNYLDFTQGVQENDLHIIFNIRIYQQKG